MHHKTGRLIELFLLFIVAPVLIALLRARTQIPVPVIPVLLLIGGTVAWLVRSDLKALVRWRWDHSAAVRIFLRFAVLGLLLAYAVLKWSPLTFFDLPREQTGLWLLIMFGYPLFSVFPQEFLFRAAFFKRYEELLGGAMATAVASCLCFGLAHLFFGTWITLLLSTVGGLLFAQTYQRTRSIWLACFEHSLYGCLVFTIGLGLYFYDS